MNTIDIAKVFASPTTHVYVFPTSRTGTAGYHGLFELRMTGAPWETHEPVLDSDKTWAWEVHLTWDPEVINVTGPGEMFRHTTKDWFDFFHKYDYDEEMMEWIDMGSYSNSFAKGYNHEEGWAKVGCTLLEDVTAIALPTEAGWPQEDMHNDSYYDLPYDASAHYAYDYFVLFRIYFTLLVDCPAGYSPIHIEAATFLEYDAKTPYTVTTTDGYVGTPPAPEFPLGIAAEIGLMVAVVYLWWTRRHKVKGVP
jgi:hypothetical protein